jgi:sterol desaturase/sphingolipid hydroxylase (fatty acid hydroxylase superfamily)
MTMGFDSIQRSFYAFANRIAGMAETRANRRAARVSDVLISLVLLIAGLLRTRAHPAEALFAVLSGLLLFTLVEYCFHRWMFHGAVPLFAPGHRRHHENPLGNDAMPFFLPPLALLGIVALVSLAVPGGLAMLLTGGLATGYAIYGLSHDLIHDTRFRNPLARGWAASHHVHHFHPDRNFGVTSPLWDIILGTRHVSRSEAKKV